MLSIKKLTLAAASLGLVSACAPSAPQFAYPTPTKSHLIRYECTKLDEANATSAAKQAHQVYLDRFYKRQSQLNAEGQKLKAAGDAATQDQISTHNEKVRQFNYDVVSETGNTGCHYIGAIKVAEKTS
ncbi:hypothetical protein [Ruegeria arenilitoris]|uniref:hypothetical protein n=1 Tax=Ruegeria arenilitoris TaxID=1173585 RepID=UPI00147C975D|nr:hypothetical protein [Ruegeria arenilitoris]